MRVYEIEIDRYARKGELSRATAQSESDPADMGVEGYGLRSTAAREETWTRKQA